MPSYSIDDTSSIVSPALVVFRETLDANLDEMVRVAGGPERLRPHCKTHKMREVIELQLARGIDKHKAATFAEAEMLVAAGARDVFLAYNLVGPNIARAVRFRQQYPHVEFFATADHAEPIAQLGEAMSAAELDIGILLDLDTGQHRTGLPAGEEAKRLYHLLSETSGVVPAGLHVYDGQNHQVSLEERTAAVMECWKPVAAMRDELVAEGIAVPRIVAGGTGSFPVFATIDDPTIELSPGTCVFHDVGYGACFPDLNFEPAAVLLTRVVSRPTANRVTLDLGYKAVASDPPAGKRVRFPALPNAEQVLQNEEHLVLETDRAEEFTPGDELIGIPRHVCPTSALHKQVYVVENGKLIGQWDVAARDRKITV